MAAKKAIKKSATTTRKKTTAKTRKKAVVKKAQAKKDVCFTIMPFGDWFDVYYDEIFCPAIKAAGMKPERADDLNRPSSIINDIWDFTREAKIILADLTGKNANVLYELGLAHAIAKPAIIVSETMDDIPFDLQQLRVLNYDRNSPNWGDNLKKAITKSIKEVLKDPEKSIPTTFLQVDESQQPTRITRHEKEILEIRRDLHSLRQLREEDNRRGGVGGPNSRSKLSAGKMLRKGMSLDLVVDTLVGQYGISRAAAKMSAMLAKKKLDKEQGIITLWSESLSLQS